MWDMPWTTSTTMIERRITEELLKRGQGDLKAEFTIPMNWVDLFDLFSNLRLQDPFGLGTGGEGEYGRYYYIESMTYDFMNCLIDIVAIDLQFVLRQCSILGSCTASDSNYVPPTWAAATEAQRMFSYLCLCGSGETGEFPSDGEPCKVLCFCD